jgi:hypothetical protein
LDRLSGAESDADTYAHSNTHADADTHTSAMSGFINSER